MVLSCPCSALVSQFARQILFTLAARKGASSAEGAELAVCKVLDIVGELCSERSSAAMLEEGLVAVAQLCSSVSVCRAAVARGAFSTLGKCGDVSAKATASSAEALAHAVGTIAQTMLSPIEPASPGKDSDEASASISTSSDGAAAGTDVAGQRISRTTLLHLLEMFASSASPVETCACAVVRAPLALSQPRSGFDRLSEPPLRPLRPYSFSASHPELPAWRKPTQGLQSQKAGAVASPLHAPLKEVALDRPLTSIPHAGRCGDPSHPSLRATCTNTAKCSRLTPTPPVWGSSWRRSRDQWRTTPPSLWCARYSLQQDRAPACRGCRCRRPPTVSKRARLFPLTPSFVASAAQEVCRALRLMLSRKPAASYADLVRRRSRTETLKLLPLLRPLALASTWCPFLPLCPTPNCA